MLGFGVGGRLVTAAARPAGAMEVGAEVIAGLDGGVARDGEGPRDLDLQDGTAGMKAAQVTTGCGG